MGFTENNTGPGPKVTVAAVHKLRFHVSKRPDVLPVVMVLAVTLLAYWPHFFTFVGTDIGVYYEIGRRLATDGKLSLWENYWDHKPILSFLIFAFFRPLDYFFANTWGLKIGALVIYLFGALSAYFAILQFCRSSYQKYIAAIGVSLCMSLALGWLDFAANGLLMTLTSFMSFSGLTIAITAKTLRKSLLAGLLIGLAPFIRPTALTAWGVLTLLTLAVSRLRNAFGKSLSIAWVIAILTITAGCSLMFVVTGPEGYATLISYNASYGSANRNITPIIEFITQDAVGFYIGLVVLLLSGVYSLRVWPSHRPIIITLGLWLATEILSMIYQRKIQSFYILGFLLPIILTFTTFVVISRPKWYTLGAFVLTGSLVLVQGVTWSKINFKVFDNQFISQDGQLTRKIPQILAEHPCARVLAPTMLVYGNRAQLYTHSADYGISPYKWPVYINPIIDGGMFVPEAEKLNDEKSTPDFIVYIGGGKWEPNSGGRIAKLESLIERNYVQLAASLGEDIEWPYDYNYRIYVKKECGNYK